MSVKRKPTVTKWKRPVPASVVDRGDLFVHDGVVHGPSVIDLRTGLHVMTYYPRVERTGVEPSFEVANTNARGITFVRVFHAPPPPGAFTTRPLDLWTDDTTLAMTLRGFTKDVRARVERLLMPGHVTLFANGVNFRQEALHAAVEEGVAPGDQVTIQAEPTNEFDPNALKVGLIIRES